VEVAARQEVRAGLRAPHFAQLAGLVTAPVGARVRLPGGLTVERAREALWVTAGGGPTTPVAIGVPGETPLPGHGGRLVTELTGPPAGPPPDSPWEAWFDRDAVAGPLRVRPARPGERFVPFGAARPVRVGRLLAAAGTPGAARPGWPLLVRGAPAADEVLWLIGVRRAAAAPVTPSTQRILRVRVVLDPVSRPREELL
jgi:hypothetical protein